MDATFRMENTIFNYRVAAVMIEDNHVLLHKQVHDKHWALPGGRVKVLEDSKTTVVREVKEELDLDVKVAHLLWMTENFFTYNAKDFHELGLYYRVFPETGDFVLRKEPFYGEEGEHLIYQWIPIEKLEEIVLQPEFLKTSLKEIPTSPEHLIVGKYDMD
ncbi:NUDIX hydrolase [Salinibacillus xinjiangensis]|uniref:NUDIX domain-containing protein n=1 Tax=Salinibacillus xinjiangensis TaxID=1229268 RepID=A0A6G1X892_9BACI|nr:NUDIX hydrolase [Salinibacillus xinjiangensis]MRG87184.1 NUDIX domain-containing protein [Salinibacillus xinjiangensis]